MSKEQTIPIVIGVTAHRAIRPKDETAIRAAVRQELIKLQKLCPGSPLVMLNSLAEGGDLLCADVAEELGLPLIAALPREREDYMRDFSAPAQERFRHHAERAQQLLVTPPTEPVPETGPQRNFQFRQAGIYVAAHCHVLIALWDGQPGKHGCGTAEAVDFALRGAYFPENGMALRSDSNEAVIHILTPRAETAGEAAGTVRVLGNWTAVGDVLQKTDEFNRLAAPLPEPGRRLLPEDAAPQPSERIYLAASALSKAAAGTYRRSLALLALASTLLTLAFLLYDEAEAIWLILVCGAMLLFAWGCQRFAARSACHRRYIEYRALAECLRVQTFLGYAGSRVLAADQLSWTQQEETAWIMDALCVLRIADAPQEAHDILDCWVEDQRAYHEKAGLRTERASAVSGRVVKLAMGISILLYLAAVIFELLWGGLLLPPIGELGTVEVWRTVLKIALGTLSAATLFVANYYGRLSLPRKLSDHGKMERFYKKMSAQLRLRGQTEELLALLAREELTENGNWISYQRDNTPDMNL